MILALDTETTGSDWWHGCVPFYVSACTDTGDLYSWEFDVDPLTRCCLPPEKDRREIRQLVADADAIVMHNAKFDIRMLSGIIPPHEINTIWDRLDDTLIMSHCLRNDWSHGLKSLASVLFHIDDDDESTLQSAVNSARAIARKHLPDWRIAGPNDPTYPAISKLQGVGWWVIDMWLPRAITTHRPDLALPGFSTVLSTYADRDAERTLLVFQALSQGLADEYLGPIYFKRMELLPITYGMESRGVRIDKKRLTKEQRSHEKEKERLTQDCFRIAPINIRSNQQVSSQLFNTWGLQPGKTTPAGDPSTSEPSLRITLTTCEEPSTQHTFLTNLLNIRKRTKSIDYLNSYKLWALNNRIHSQLNITGTTFTRQSSNNPNLQNVGTGKSDPDFNLRTVFVPEKRRSFISIDYSNLELRIWAYSCGNPELIEAFETGESVHLVIALELHPFLNSLSPDEAKNTPEYACTKNGNFAIIYGAGEKTANLAYKVPGAYTKIAKRFPEVKKFTQSLFSKIQKEGYIRTLGGYKLRVPPDEPHKVVSAFVQGTAGDVIGEAMRRCAAITSTMSLQVHDEIVFEVPNETVQEYSEKLCITMESVGDMIGMPLPVGAAIHTDNWGE